jgi:patatin-like phospholipase/acyl hydrolase
VDHFDLICGTSTGGIIAIGLAMGIPARDILRFCGEEGFRIFPRTGGAGGSRRRFWGETVATTPAGG